MTTQILTYVIVAEAIYFIGLILFTIYLHKEYNELIKHTKNQRK